MIEDSFNDKFSSDFKIIAGPCAIENEETTYKVANCLKKMGLKYIRGGAFKPRTSPKSFQGLGERGLKILKNAAKENDLITVSEIMDPRNVDMACEYLDIIQIGARNMHNYPLLKEVGKTDKIILLKRGFGATIEEWIQASEYIRLEGNESIILCERGIRTFEPQMRNTLDIAGVSYLKKHYGYNVILDPSHGTGKRELIEPMIYVAMALNCEGVMIEIHPEPEKALSDGEQSLSLEQFEEIVGKVREKMKKPLMNKPLR